MLALPIKFHPYLLNEKPDTASQKICHDLTEFFQKKSFIEPVCHMFPGWVIKGQAECKTEDQHLYRIRKAEKIAACLEVKHLTCFMVPEKRLFRYEDSYYVLSQFMKGKTISVSDLSEKEILELIEISLSTYFLDFTHNFIRLPSGQIAIIDTESRLRSFYKSMPSCSLWVGGAITRRITKNSLKRIHALNACYEFANYCREDVKHVFKKGLNQSIQRRVAKLGLLLFSVLALLSVIAVSKPALFLPAALLSWFVLYNVLGIIKREVLLFLLPLDNVN